MLNSNKISRWMHRSAKSFVDPITGDISCTALAEAACDQFSGYAGNIIPDLFFELAIETMTRIADYGYPGEKNKDRSTTR